MSYNLKFFTDDRGRKQAEEWIEDSSNASIKPSIQARITDLSNRGPLLNKQKLPQIEPKGKEKEKIHGFYELKHRREGWRIAVYHDLDENCIYLLNGFRKSQQSSGITRAYKLVRQHLQRKREGV